MEKAKKIEKKEPQKKQQRKQKKPDATKVERYVDKALQHCGGGSGRLLKSDIYIDDFAYDLHDGEVEGGVVLSDADELTEVSVYDAIKNSKHFNKEIDALVKDMTHRLVTSTTQAKKNLILQQKREAQRIAANAKRAKQLAAARKRQVAVIKEREAELKMQHAQKLVFNEGLSSEQKKAFKKLYGIDLVKQTKTLPPTNYYYGDDGDDIW